MVSPSRVATSRWASGSPAVARNACSRAASGAELLSARHDSDQTDTAELISSATAERIRTFAIDSSLSAPGRNRRTAPIAAAALATPSADGRSR